MADLNATTYNKILSKGIEANLPVNIGVNKLRFTTDTGRLFLDNEGTDRVEITDFIKGKTKDEILGTLAPLPKFYLASDTQEIYYYDTTEDEWKSISVTTTQYAVESGHSINADTASYATNASSSSYSDDAISNITRNGLVFTVTKNDNSTFTFDQQDNDTTYAEASTESAGLLPTLEGGTTKYLRADGSWFQPPNDNTTYTNGAGIGLDGSSFTNAGVREINVNGNNININTNGTTVDITVPFATNASSASYASTATADGLGNVITSTYAPLASPVFTGSPTAPDVADGDKSTKIANTKFVDTAIAAAIAGVTQFDYEIVTELPSTGEKGVIYLVSNGSSTSQNIYDEYIWLTDRYEKIATTEIDLSNYVNNTTVTGTGNAITGVTKSGNTITFSKDSTFLTSIPDYYATTASFSNNGSTLSWGNTSAIGVAAGTTYTITMPDNPNTDTTYALATTASEGLMPALEGGTTKYLRADGTWETVATSDTKVTQTESTANNNYEVLLSNNASTAEETDGVKKSSGMKYNPSTGNLTISGNLTDKFGLQSIRRISEADYNSLSTEEKNNGTIYNIYDKTGSSAILPGDFVGATTATAGEHGLVPAPTTADVEKFLKGDGTWAESTGTTYDDMTINEGIGGSSTVSRVITAANLKGILQGSTYIYSYAPCVEADFDFGELTANSEVYNQ